MFEFIKSIVGPIIGGCLGTGAGWLLFRWKRRSDGLDDMRNTIADLQAELAISGLVLDDFFRESIPLIGKGCHRVRRHLDDAQWKRLNDLWLEYKSHPAGNFNYTTEAAMKHAMLIHSKPPEVLRSFFSRFEECIPRN